MKMDHIPPKPILAGLTIDHIYEIAEQEGITPEEVDGRIWELIDQIWINFEIKGPIRTAIHRVFGQRHDR